MPSLHKYKWCTQDDLELVLFFFSYILQGQCKLLCLLQLTINLCAGKFLLFGKLYPKHNISLGRMMILTGYVIFSNTTISPVKFVFGAKRLLSHNIDVQQ